MKIGVYQFSSTNSIRNNLETIKKLSALPPGKVSDWLFFTNVHFADILPSSKALMIFIMS